MHSEISNIAKVSASLNGATSAAYILMATSIQMHIVRPTVNTFGVRLDAYPYHAGGVLSLAASIVPVNLSLESVNIIREGVCWFVALA
jgi:hypothetical protein